VKPEPAKSRSLGSAPIRALGSSPSRTSTRASPAPAPRERRLAPPTPPYDHGSGKDRPPRHTPTRSTRRHPPQVRTCRVRVTRDEDAETLAVRHQLALLQAADRRAISSVNSARVVRPAAGSEYCSKISRPVPARIHLNHLRNKFSAISYQYFPTVRSYRHCADRVTVETSPFQNPLLARQSHYSI
jgi:hypothetical protein